MDTADGSYRLYDYVDGWEPKYTLDTLIQDMMQNDIKLMKKESYLKEGGYKILNYFE